MENRKFKYDFFISYKHGKMDSRISGYLQKKLESYKIPREIQKRCGKEKITRVFRDKEELSVTVDLSLEIEEQLKNTEYLIVMCSPQSKQSQWVNREVTTFLKHRGWEYVLPVLIEGEPKDAFPEILNEREMLAADVRGKSFAQVKRKCKHEILRLIAPALGCSYDELRQRNRAYASRRMAATAIGLAAVAIGFGAYAWNQSVQIQENYWKKMESQAGLLAEKSVDLLESGDRDAALLVALEALPESLESTEKPLVGKAQIALEEALYLYEQKSVTAPRAMHTLKMDNNLQQIYALNNEKDVLVSCDIKNNFYIWDLNDGSLKCKFKGLQGKDETCVDLICGSGTQVFICTYKKVICFDYEKQETLWEITAEDFVSWNDYALSPSQDQIAMCSQGEVFLISTETGERKGQYAFGESSWSPSDIIWNPNEKQLCLVNSGFLGDGQVLLLSLEDGSEKIVKTFDDWLSVAVAYKNEDTIACAWASLDDYSLGYSYAYSDYWVSEIDCGSGKVLWEIQEQTLLRDSDLEIRFVNQEKDGEVYDLTTVVMGSEVIAVRDGELWAEFAYDSMIVGRVSYGLFEIHTTEKGVNYLVSWDGRYILNERYDTLELGLEDVYITAGIVDNGLVAFPGFSGGTIYVYKPLQDDEYTEIENSDEALYISYSPDMRYRIASDSSDEDYHDQILNLWDMETGENIFRQEFFYDGETYVGDRLDECGFIDSRYFYYCTYDKIVICDVTTLEEVASYEYKRNGDSYFERIEDVWAVGGENPGIFFNDGDNILYFFSMLEKETSIVLSKEKRDEIYSKYYGEALYGLYFTADPTGSYVFFTASPYNQKTEEPQIFIWDVKNQSVCGDFMMPFDTYNGFGMEFSEDGSQMLFQNAENGLQLMHLEDGTVEIIPVEGENHQDFWFSPDERYIFVYTYDYFLKVYDRESGKLTMNLECEAANLKSRYFAGEDLYISVTYTMSQPVMFSYRKTGDGVYECYSKISNCELIANGKAYVRPNSTYLLYCYPHRNLDEMISMAKEILNGRELTDIERQRYSIDE